MLTCVLNLLKHDTNFLVCTGQVMAWHLLCWDMYRLSKNQICVTCVYDTCSWGISLFYCICLFYFAKILYLPWIVIIKTYIMNQMCMLIISVVLIPGNICILLNTGQGEVAILFPMTFSNAFSWMKMYKFRLRFHWSFFPRAKLTIFQRCFR